MGKRRKQGLLTVVLLRFTWRDVSRCCEEVIGPTGRWIFRLGLGLLGLCPRSCARMYLVSRLYTGGFERTQPAFGICLSLGFGSCAVLGVWRFALAIYIAVASG